MTRPNRYKYNQTNKLPTSELSVHTSDHGPKSNHQPVESTPASVLLLTVISGSRGTTSFVACVVGNERGKANIAMDERRSREAMTQNIYLLCTQPLRPRHQTGAAVAINQTNKRNITPKPQRCPHASSCFIRFVTRHDKNRP